MVLNACKSETRHSLVIVVPFFCFASHVFIFALLVVLSPLVSYSRNSDPGSHSSRPFSHLPTAVLALPFSREKGSELSSLVDLRLIVPIHAVTGAIESDAF